MGANAFDNFDTLILLVPFDGLDESKFWAMSMRFEPFFSWQETATGTVTCWSKLRIHWEEMWMSSLGCGLVEGMERFSENRIL